MKLAYILDREGGWETVKEWTDVLSGGEKQRMAIGRLCYQKPTYAVLDECTSAVSMDVEAHLYHYMKTEGITLITVSQRDSLWKFHEYLLRFQGDQQYEFGKMPQEKLINDESRRTELEGAGHDSESNKSK